MCTRASRTRTVWMRMWMRVEVDSLARALEKRKVDDIGEQPAKKRILQKRQVRKTANNAREPLQGATCILCREEASHEARKRRVCI